MHNFWKRMKKGDIHSQIMRGLIWKNALCNSHGKV